MSLTKMLLDLLKVREANREKLFNGFVKPAYESFNAAHKSYLECFQKYRDTIATAGQISDADIASLEEILLNDSRFHRHLRHTAISEADILRDSRRHDFMPFIDSITTYFEGPLRGKSDMVQKVNQLVMYSNGARAVLFMALELLRASLLSEKERASISVTGLDEIIEYLQSQHAVVHGHYLQAKKKLTVT